MLKIYHTNLETNETKETEKIERGCWINMVAPSEEEIKKVCKATKINDDFIRYALDFEEKARIDIEDEDNTTLFIIDIPMIEKENDGDIYSTMPIGMIVVRDDFFITVSIKQNPVIKYLSNNLKMIRTYKKSRMILQIFYKNSENFLDMLKKINKEAEVAEKTLKKSLRNTELLHILNLQKSLVYFTTSIKSNELVMEKTMRGKIIKLYEEDEDILEDSIIENKQAIEMSQIYSNILNGTMDAYASVISNNLNGMMKFLTSITIIIAIPTMIASYWGMNVRVPLQDNPFGFVIIFTLSIILGILASIWLKRRDMLN